MKTDIVFIDEKMHLIAKPTVCCWNSLLMHQHLFLVYGDF